MWMKRIFDALNSLELENLNFSRHLRRVNQSGANRVIYSSMPHLVWTQDYSTFKKFFQKSIPFSYKCIAFPQELFFRTMVAFFHTPPPLTQIQYKVMVYFFVNSVNKNGLTQTDSWHGFLSKWVFSPRNVFALKWFVLLLIYIYHIISIINV